MSNGVRTTAAATRGKRAVLLVPHNHFDPTWRRCFDRRAEYRGVTVRSYAEVEAHCFEAWLGLVDRGYPFSEGQTAILRKYLEQHPRRKADLRKQARSGLFDVPLAGEVVPDTVMSTAEGLVRNFLVAAPLYRDLLGGNHPALKIAWLEDAFGNSPNYPQVLRGVGAETAAFLSYRPCPEHIWVGIDGTKIPTLDRHPSGFAGAFAKHPPCPQCRGQGCKACRQTGLLFVDGFDLGAVRKAIEDAGEKTKETGWVAVRMLTEEVLPDGRVADLVAELDRRHAGEYRVRFANLRDIYARHRPVTEAALRERGDKPSDDLNPAMPGCMVSRIRCKQRTRSVAYHLVAAEAALANAAWRKGRPAALPAAFAQAWQRVAFSQFHDAITGTHIDSAHTELMDMLDEAEAVARKYRPIPPAHPATGAFKAAAGTVTLRLGQLDVTADRCGITAIRCGGQDVFGQFPPPWNNRSRSWRIAELTLESDFGDAWGKRVAGGIGPGDFGNTPLGDCHTAFAVAPQGLRWKGKYAGGAPKVRRLEWTTTVTPSVDGRRLEFRTEVDWDTGSRRLRVQVPVKSQDPTATYEVPFGFVDRIWDAKKLDYSLWSAHQMEFPTLHWVRKAVDANSGVALLNKGLPCNRWAVPGGGEGGILDLSLVRSPEFEFCAVEPASYEFWDIDGMRDAGRHVFEYALLPYVNRLSLGDLTRIGYEYNLPVPMAVPFTVQGDVVMTAWKPAENGSGWILRLQEAGGRLTQVRIEFAEPRQVAQTDLLERPAGKAARGTRYATALHKHGILTLWIR